MRNPLSVSDIKNVLLDRDLAALYGVTTKRLDEQVRRNLARFPGDFMFQLTVDEEVALRSHFATSKTPTPNRGGRRYLPYALTEHCVAKQSPILPSVVRQASITAVAALDESFFRVRFDRLTPKEKKYLRAMAELGAGPHRSGDIAESFDAVVSSLAPTRSSLIAKGMVWSPNHGDTAFTVPMFDEFMKRVMPGNKWR